MLVYMYPKREVFLAMEKKGIIDRRIKANSIGAIAGVEAFIAFRLDFYGFI